MTSTRHRHVIITQAKRRADMVTQALKIFIVIKSQSIQHGRGKRGVGTAYNDAITSVTLS